MFNLKQLRFNNIIITVTALYFMFTVIISRSEKPVRPNLNVLGLSTNRNGCNRQTRNSLSPWQLPLSIIFWRPSKTPGFEFSLKIWRPTPLLSEPLQPHYRRRSYPWSTVGLRLCVTGVFINTGSIKRIKPRLHQGNMLPGNMLPVAINMFRQNCWQFVARLLLNIKGYMLPRYRQHIAGNKQHVFLCCSSGCRATPWCKRGLTHAGHSIAFLHFFDPVTLTFDLLT